MGAANVTRRLVGCVVGLTVALGADAPGPEVGPHRVETVTGTVHVGRLVGFSPAWKLRLLVSAAREVEFDARDVLSVVRRDVPRRSHPEGLCLVFANGDRLYAELVDGTDEVIHVRHARIGPLAVPVKALAAVFWTDHVPDAELDRWIADLSTTRRTQDRVWLRNNDRLAGVVGAITPIQVGLTGELGGTKIPTKNVRGVLFNSDTTELVVPRELYAVLTLRDDSRVSVSRLVGDGDTLTARTLFGPELKLSALDVAACEFRNGRIVYVSDLTPAEYVHEPFLSLSWPWRADRAVDGAPLRLRGRLFRKGLGTHSRCRLVFALDGRYRQFRSLVGVDDTARGRGSVVFRVRVDDRVVFDSGVLTGSDPPKDVTVPLANADRLVLEVDYGPDGDVLDRADWADARLLR